MLDVLCVGYSCFDLAFPFPGLPDLDQKHEVDRLVLDGGGPAATAAVALRRLGCRVGLISTLGDDWWGRFALRRLKQEGLAQNDVLVESGSTSPLSVILVDPPSGARTILWNRGTLRPLSAARVRERWRPARVVFVDEAYPEAAEDAMCLAHSQGAPVVFDAGSVQDGLRGLVRGADFLVTSEQFPTGYTGLADPERALVSLHRENGRPVIATRGAKGCWLFDGDRLTAFPAEPILAKDTTGAGDAFHAALAFGVLHGWRLETACRFAVYYSSQNCLHFGGRAGLLNLGQIKGWLEAEGIEGFPKR